ncbi:trihelix transcription factor ASR3-like [Lotus japonicus]|uniref:trihelix transcription factor ASR3-like n=1 Tax=Lotus japonicus TaxID=34305 RepID=UPI0025827BD4|nr:trihelix transcription factor ASR3-like [Lotus japonicus]
MTDPSTTPIPPPPINIPDPHHHHHHNHHLPLLHGTTTAPPLPSSSSAPRDYRKGNWTIQETLILITAKKLDDERRLKASSPPPPPTTTTTPHDPSTTPRPSPAACSAASSSRTSGELRWKWVENYCWSHGCLRSQNQCNDKWDNLLRDYKKVRDYESKSESKDHNYNFPSYWTLNKQQRKDHNLPSNMVFEIYQAISDVLQRKNSQRFITTTTPQQQQQQQPLVTLVTSTPPPQHPQPLQAQPLPPPPPPPPQPPATSITPAGSEKTESSGSEQSDQEENNGSESSKRRKVRNIGSSIMRSASVLARALRSCEEKKEKRHREMMELEQRRIQMEENRNEVHRQGLATLVTAVSNLSGAIQSFINSQRHGQR